jgi:NADPH:quinone reductase-like Zn-dependent oxidoreductase
LTAGKGLAAAADKAATATTIGVMSMLVPAYAAVIIDGISDVENDLANAKLALVQAEFLAAHSANTDLEEAASLSAAVYVAHARVNGLKVTLAFLNAAT